MPIVKDKSGFDLQAKYDLDAIRNSISNIFNWKKGERILNPEFGNPLEEYLYETINPMTARSIGAAFKNAIVLWEPRVVVNNINVIANEDSNEYRIVVTISVPTLNINSITYDYVLPVG